MAIAWLDIAGSRVHVGMRNAAIGLGALVGSLCLVVPALELDCLFKQVFVHCTRYAGRTILSLCQSLGVRS